MRLAVGHGGGGGAELQAVHKAANRHAALVLHIRWGKGGEKAEKTAD
jgi:hypothetical protein